MATTMVDWNVASQTARRLVKPGPEITRTGAQSAVAELRAAAVRAEAYVAEVTGLRVPGPTAPVLVVDRPGWIQANLDGFRHIVAPLTAKFVDRMGDNPSQVQQTMAQVGARVTGAEIGALLSYLSPKVLGQFDPFYPGVDGEPGGRLLLVAPNIVHVERELQIDPADFRLWVCLHEETHRVQFTAVPWLRDHLNGLIEKLVSAADLDAGMMVDMIKAAARRVGDGLRGDEEISIIDLIQTPAQRDTVDAVTAVMSLLEGHADVVMDSVGPEVIDSIAQIRRKFNVRREGQGFDKVIRKLLGLDAKIKQYRDGAAFCRRVLDRVGMSGLNQVWTSAETLPSKDEIAFPDLWLNRVHGMRA